MSGLWSSRNRIIIAGLIIGTLAALMTKLGNPQNMGICVACFIRDTAGALGLHRADTVQYIRPEIIGFVLGAFTSSIIFREFRARGGSSPLIRFFLGAFLMVGALVFLGCPTRAVLRFAGGDLNGATGLLGIVAGVLMGIFFLKRGFNLGRASRLLSPVGWVIPGIMLGILALALFHPSFIFVSSKGPGSLSAPLGLSLAAGLVIGAFAQKVRLCFVGAWRDIFLVRDTYLISGVAAFFIAALATNYITGSFGSGAYHWGFVNEPIAHANHLWNFLGMGLVGLTATLAGGCPLRNLILSGEGDADAGVFVLGLFTGAAFAHNFTLASSPGGVTTPGMIAVIIGLFFSVAIGFLMRQEG